jgi:hypothetical protein
MRQREDPERRASPPEARKVVRKPYQKPAVRHEQVFETSALSCGKVQGTQASCHFNRKVS